MPRKKIKRFDKGDNYALVPHRVRSTIKDEVLSRILLLLYLDRSFGTRLKTQTVAGEEVTVELQPGEILGSAGGLAKELGIPKTTVYRNLKILEENEYLTIRPVNKYLSIYKLSLPEKGQWIDREGPPAPYPEQPPADPELDRPPPYPNCPKCSSGGGEWDYDPYKDRYQWWCDQVGDYLEERDPCPLENPDFYAEETTKGPKEYTPEEVPVIDLGDDEEKPF